jgi:hypothetical protein
LIGTATGLQQKDPLPDIVVGHWHGDGFVPVEVPYETPGTHPLLKVTWWAEIPDQPKGVDLQTLVGENWLG